MEGSLLDEEELKRVSNLFIYLFIIGTPYYYEGCEG
jgi:hypothetical protein